MRQSKLSPAKAITAKIDLTIGETRIIVVLVVYTKRRDMILSCPCNQPILHLAYLCQLSYYSVLKAWLFSKASSPVSTS